MQVAVLVSAGAIIRQGKPIAFPLRDTCVRPRMIWLSQPSVKINDFYLTTRDAWHFYVARRRNISQRLPRALRALFVADGKRETKKQDDKKGLVSLNGYLGRRVGVPTFRPNRADIWNLDQMTPTGHKKFALDRSHVPSYWWPLSNQVAELAFFFVFWARNIRISIYNSALPLYCTQ